VPVEVFVELAATEEHFLLGFKVPFDERAVFTACDKALVVFRPVHACDSSLVSLHECALKVVIANHLLVRHFRLFTIVILHVLVLLKLFVACKVISNRVEELALLF